MRGWLKEISLKKNIALRGLYYLISLACARIISKPLILCFHRVKVPSDSLLDKRVGCISPDNFRKVIRFMRLMGYTFVALEDLVTLIEQRRFEKVAAVTFDDGFKDLYENAYPVLKERQIPFTLFLITSLIGARRPLWLHRLYILLETLTPSERSVIFQKYGGRGENGEDPGEVVGRIIHSRDKATLEELELEVSESAKMNTDDETFIAGHLYLSKEEIDEMKSNGLTVEAHGHEHWPLRSLNFEDTRSEIRTSMDIIREKWGSQPRYMALQYGKESEHVRGFAEGFGLKGILTMQGRIITEESLDLYSLPRFCIYDNVQAFYRAVSIQFLRHLLGKPRRT